MPKHFDSTRSLVNSRLRISQRVEDILTLLQIKDRTSEPHNKNQNHAERVWQQVKRHTEATLNFSNAPPMVWLLALECVCFVDKGQDQ